MPPKGLVKGSQEMKDYMAKIRGMRGKNTTKKTMTKSKSMKGMGIGADLGGIAGARYGPVGSILGSAVGDIGEKLVRRKFGLGNKKGGALYPAGY